MDKESFATKCGRWFGNVVVGCITICLAAIVIALTIRIITLLV